MQVERVLYTKDGVVGDFKWMLKQPEYNDALLIIMENVIDSIDPEADDGGGTAAIRTKTWLHMSEEELAVGPPRATGIPSGFSVRCGGFTFLDRSIVKQYIDLSFERLLLILHTYPQIKRVIYSANKDDPLKIGSGIFKPTPAVIDYISRGINGLSNTVPRSLLSFEEIRDKELQLAHVPLALNYAKFLRQQLASRKPEVRKAEAGQSSLLTLGVSRAQAKPGAMLGSGKAAPPGKAPLVKPIGTPNATGGIVKPARLGVGSKRSIGNSNIHTFVKK